MERYGSQNTKLYNALSVLMGAMLVGFLWRMRGETGWGSSWGLLAVGFVFALFLCVVAGNRQKMNLPWMSITALSFMFTVPSWGTLIAQTTGMLDSLDGYYEGLVNRPIPISPWSGVAMMLLMGFGLASLFGVMLGRGFSGTPWKWYHFVTLLVVFFGSYYLSLATIAHPLVRLIQPEAIAQFEYGLRESNIPFDNVRQVFLDHFNNLGWAKHIGGGRNYFSELQAVSATIRAICVLLVTRFVIKDKTAARLGLLTCLVFAVSITIANITFFLNNGGLHRAHESLWPTILGHSWPCWEYLTGFFAGGAITFAVLRTKKQEDISEPLFDFLPEKVKGILAIILSFGFAMGVNLVRPVLERLRDATPVLQITATAVTAVVCILVLCLVLRKNHWNALNVPLEKFAPALVAVYTVYYCLVYLFVGTESERHMQESFTVLLPLILLSGVAVAAFCLFGRKKKSA